MKNIYLAGGISSIDDWRERLFPALKTKREPTEYGDYRCVGPFWVDRGTTHGGKVGEPRRSVWERNNAALATADLLFAWLDGDARYGTIAEIVEASKHGVPVALTFGPNTTINEHWYVAEYAQKLLIPRRVHVEDLPVVFADVLRKTEWRAIR